MTLIDELNAAQFKAVTLSNQHALVLAGAGSGKTKTIVARAAYLIESGIPAQKIKILTFTRRAASEIVERVKLAIGESATHLSASTFHAWCMHLMHAAPQSFGVEGNTIIDRDDQLQLIKALRGRKDKGTFPSANELINLYSFTRNTNRSLAETIELKMVEFVDLTTEIGQLLVNYEDKKERSRYLDYDDILEVVALQMEQVQEVADWIGGHYEYILLDEMQDTNPLQWRLIDPLKNIVTLFAVGDDAQSIYGFRGADFKNIHCFSDRVPDSIILKLEDNYRSTQDILNPSNWLLEQSPLNYNKVLRGVRGSGKKPQLISFLNEWEEVGWVVSDLQQRNSSGESWKDHMILVRSGYTGRLVESALLAAKIPYSFIGGFKLLESAHIKDCLSIMRLVANPFDEIAAMRYFLLWPGIGEVRAAKLVDLITNQKDFNLNSDLLVNTGGLPKQAGESLKSVWKNRNNVTKAFRAAFRGVESLLAAKYQGQGWDKRKPDFKLVEKLTERHTSILSFIEEYLLDPLHSSNVMKAPTKKDHVTIITIHSAKGTECKVCYVMNCSPGVYPSPMALAEDSVEEERRVLYVAFTRAKDELIVTRSGPTLGMTGGDYAERAYFLNGVPDELFESTVHRQGTNNSIGPAPFVKRPVRPRLKILPNGRNE